MAFDNAYGSLASGGENPRWAFGTRVADPPSAVRTAVPDGVDPADLAAYCLMLGDDALVFSHRLQQWCTRLPELEEEVAIANIGLDLLGQARLLLSRAGAVDGSGRGEDDLAFWRDVHEFRNVRLAETANGDFGELVARLLVLSTWRLAVLDRLTASRDPVVSAIAARGVKELTYHRDHAAAWTVRLGDGTANSRERIDTGLATAWPYVEELFAATDEERRLAGAGVGVDPEAARGEFDAVLERVLDAATLRRPSAEPLLGVGGRTGRHGVHTEAMGDLLEELQSVARAHPGATW